MPDARRDLYKGAVAAEDYARLVLDQVAQPDHDFTPLHFLIAGVLMELAVITDTLSAIDGHLEHLVEHGRVKL